MKAIPIRDSVSDNKNKGRRAGPLDAEIGRFLLDGHTKRDHEVAMLGRRKGRR